MQNPANSSRGAAAKNEARNSIIPLTAASTQDTESRSPLPPLPPHLDKVLDLPWNPESNQQIDQWLWYLSKEFEAVGGWQ